MKLWASYHPFGENKTREQAKTAFLAFKRRSNRSLHHEYTKQKPSPGTSENRVGFSMSEVTAFFTTDNFFKL
jgi:hypothetical protein